MVRPTLNPNDRTQISERHHSDPPGLWVLVTLTSIVLHLFVIGMLRLLLIERLDGLQSGKTLVPIDVIALSPEAPSSTQVSQSGGSVPRRTPTPRNNPNQRRSNQPVDPSTSSVPTGSSTRTNTDTPKVASSPINKRSPATNPYPTQPSDLPSQPSSRNPSQNQTPSPAPSPTSPKPSPSQPSAPAPNPPAPKPSASQPPTPAPEPSTPKPSPSQPPTPAPGPISPSPQPRGGFRATIGGLTLTDPGRDIPTRYAQLRPNSTTQFPPDSLTPLGINPNQVLVLKATVVIESTGQATVVPNSAQVSPGNISADKAEQLAKQIIENWTFEPTYMESGPVAQAYNIEVNLSPL